MEKKTNRPKTLLAQANALTQSRYDFSVIEKRAVYAIIKEVRKQFIEQEGQRDLFENLVVKIKKESLTGVSENLEQVYQGLRSLRRKDIWIEDDEQVLNVGYINYFKDKKREPFVEVEVSKTILPYLVELAKGFTAYYLTVAMSLKNKYSQRFYEYCSQFKSSGFFTFSIEELRQKLKIEDKYPRYGLVKSYVIEPARKELAELYEQGHSDVCFSYSEEKAGRSVQRLKFYVKNKAAEHIEELKPEDYEFYIRSWLNTWLKAEKRPKNKAWIDKVMKSLQLHPENLKKCYNKLVWVQKKKQPEDFAPYARFVIEEEYLNEE